jgi:signal transduction histidine kinase
MHPSPFHNTSIEALRLSEQRAQLALDVARLGTWTWTREGHGSSRIELDARCREICGIDPDGVVTREELFARIHPEDRRRVEQALAVALDPGGFGQFAEEIRFLHADGSVRWTVSRGRTRFAGERDACVAELFGSVVDITARVSFNDRYRTLFDAIDRGFCVVEVLFDAAGTAVDYRFLETNPRFMAETGLVDAVGKRMRELSPAHEEHWFRIYGEVARSGVPVRFENQAEALGRWFDVYAYRVGDPLARQVGILFADITERRRTEQTLRDADRRKDEFLATLAHELRNPLAPLRTALDILQLTDDADTARRLRAIMTRQVDQLTRLVEDLMEVSRITRGNVRLRLADVDLVDVARAAIETSRPLMDERGQVLDVALPASPLPVRGDAMRLAQVIVNLLNNAARYGRAGGRVWLRASRDHAQVVLSVRDDGIGIAPDKLQSIFQPFTQLNREAREAQGGLGIGLSLVRSLVQRHGGTVVACSAGEGQGSEFIVRLPAATATIDEDGDDGAKARDATP